MSRSVFKKEIVMSKSLAQEALEYFQDGKPLTEEHAFALTKDRVLNPRGDIYFGGESLTDQSQKDDCDINNLMAQYTITGNVRGMREELGLYGDFSELGDYQDMLERVQAAKDLFMELPAKVREEFRHNPQVMLDFVNDPKNKARAIELGLVDPPKVDPGPMKVEVVNPKEPPK